MSIIQVDDVYDETGELYKWTNEQPKTSGMYFYRCRSSASGNDTAGQWWTPEVVMIDEYTKFSSTHVYDVQWSDRPIKLPKVTIEDIVQKEA